MLGLSSAWSQGDNKHILKSMYQPTVAPRYSEPRYNEDPIIMNNIWKPDRIK